MNHESTFDIKTPNDFFKIVVLPQYEDFISKNSSQRHALLAILVTYHMYEWVNGTKFTVTSFKSKYSNYTGLSDTFEIARKIANGTKHFLPTTQTKTQVGFSSSFSNAFARPLIIKFPNGSEKPVDMFLEDMINFWKKESHEGKF